MYELCRFGIERTMGSVSVKQRRQDLWVRLVLQVFVESDRQVELMPAEASVVKIDNVQPV